MLFLSSKKLVLGIFLASSLTPAALAQNADVVAATAALTQAEAALVAANADVTLKQGRRDTAQEALSQSRQQLTAAEALPRSPDREGRIRALRQRVSNQERALKGLEGDLALAQAAQKSAQAKRDAAKTQLDEALKKAVPPTPPTPTAPPVPPGPTPPAPMPQPKRPAAASKKAELPVWLAKSQNRDEKREILKLKEAADVLAERIERLKRIEANGRKLLASGSEEAVSYALLILHRITDARLEREDHEAARTSFLEGVSDEKLKALDDEYAELLELEAKKGPYAETAR